MDKRMQEILENYEKNALGMDDTFQFKCRECGKCCKNREDILLTIMGLTVNGILWSSALLKKCPTPTIMLLLNHSRSRFTVIV